MEHRIFHHGGVVVCVKCAGRNPRPGQEWPLSVDGAPSVWTVVARVWARPSHLAPCPIPHGAFGWVDSGEGLGWR